MKWVRVLLFVGVASTGVVLPAPAGAATAAKRISIEYRGPLKEALKKIAAEGGINLVASGDLNQQAEVYLKGVSPEEALKTVATAYHLRIDQSGSIWTLRPMTEAERMGQVPPAPPPPPAAPREAESAPSEPSPSSNEKEEPSASDRAMRDAAEALAKPNSQRDRRADAKLLKQRLKEIAKHRRHPGSNDRVVQGSLAIGEGETVRNATALGGSLMVNGTVTGDAVALGGPVTVNGHVAGAVVAIGGGVHLGPNAVVDGDVVAFGGEVSKEEGAEIGGDQTSSSALTSIGIESLMRTIKKDAADRSDAGSEENTSHFPWFRRWHFGVPSFLLWFALLFAVGFMLMVFAPGRMHQIESDLKSEPLKCGLAGLVGFIALIPLSIMLAITVVGLLVVPVVLFLACLGVAMGMSAVANEIGMRLPFFRGRKTQALVLAVGTLVLLLVAKVPLIGPLAIAVLMTLAFGAAIRTRFGQAPKGVPQPI
jgi:hypothetical protein